MDEEEETAGIKLKDMCDKELKKIQRQKERREQMKVLEDHKQRNNKIKHRQELKLLDART
jgi:hypothetical protein